MSRKKNVALLSVASNTLLIVLKLIAGVLSGSVSIISEAIHSMMDLVAAVIAFFAVRLPMRRRMTIILTATRNSRMSPA